MIYYEINSLILTCIGIDISLYCFLGNLFFETAKIRAILLVLRNKLANIILNATPGIIRDNIQIKVVGVAIMKKT